jgi:hypothetical protein
VVESHTASQHEVIARVGSRVLEAVEMLLRSLDRADQEQGRHLLRGVREADLYDASVTILMRLVFLFCAEDRDQHQVVSTLLEHLRQTAAQDSAEYLLSGSKVFESSLQSAICNLQSAIESGFRLLEIEQIGQVYEGLLDHTTRRSSGSHYTPRSLTELIVRYTLEPLVYIGPTEGWPRNEWKLKSARELLDLKICDPACGSGAFLVQACRYLGERLEEAFQIADCPPDASFSGSPDQSAIRLVAQRCLYGVDKNPQAVEMARLSLWLLTGTRDGPFGFLDHAIRCGDSLVGLRDLEQLQHFELDSDGATNTPFRDPLRQWLLTGGEAQRERLKLAADLLVAAELTSDTVAERKARRDAAAVTVAEHFRDADLSGFRRSAQQALAGQPRFHWPLEFPEVMVERGGFDAFLGNPPFINAIDGGITEGMKAWLRGRHPHLGGTADLSYYFLARMHETARPGGTVGLILPRAFLNAPAAEQLRRSLLRGDAGEAARPPALIYCPDGRKLFNAANVRVVALSLGGRPSCHAGDDFPLREIVLRSDNWWEPFASTPHAPRSSPCAETVGQRFEVMASMTTGMAYELLPFLVDEAEGTRLRFVTTGLIDPNLCLWGRVRCRYLRRTFSTPRIAIQDDISATVLRRLELIQRPKVLVAGVAGPGNRLEAFVDRDGSYCGAVSTFTVLDRDDNLSRLDDLCTILNSTATARRVAEMLGATAMGSGLLTITRDFLQSLPLPTMV